MTLVLGRAHADRIAAEGRLGYPHECCGFLLGEWSDQAKRVRDVRPAENARSDSPHNRYLIPPEAFLHAEKEARERSLEIVGFYHSHPDVEARPSAFDRDHAWAGYSYVIVRVRGGAPRETRSWELLPDRSEFVEESLSIVEAPAASEEKTPLADPSLGGKS
jgi:proteasome lid subunit RPN8/RPN11